MPRNSEHFDIATLNANICEAFALADFDALSQCYLPDAEMYLSGANRIAGRRAIARAFRLLHTRIARIELASRWNTASGNVRAERGAYRHVHSDGTEYGKGEYLVLWQHTSAGWRVREDWLWAEGGSP